MAFTVTNLNVDLKNNTANLVAIDQGTTSSKVVQVQFPFDPPAAEAREQGRAIAAAKAILQQCLNEI